MQFIKKHKVLMSVLAVILVLAAAAFWFVWGKLNLLQYSQGNDQPAGEAGQEETEAPAEDILSAEDMEGLEQMDPNLTLAEGEIFGSSDVMNILLLGTDERSPNFSTNARSDSMMILSLNKKLHTAKLVSLERGMGVPVLEGPYEGQYDWLTHIFRYGGADLVMKTVETCFKVDVDRYVRVNFNTVTQLIDSIGGVDIELTQAEVDGLSGKVYTNAIAKHPVTVGLNHLDGYDALQYSRLRFIDSDWKRVQRQRKVIQAAVDATKDMSLLEINQMANDVLPLIQTNLTKTEIANLALIAPGFLGCQLDQMTIPAKGTYGSMVGMGGRHLFAVDFEKNSQILHDFFYSEPTEEPTGEAAAKPEN